MATRFQLSFSVLAFLAVVSLRIRTTDGCSPVIPEPPQTLEYKMFRSDVVAKGYTRHRHRDSSFPHDKVYMVDFEIRCIFKGDPLPEVIRIYQVGTIGGHCLSTEMPKNRSLLVYLSQRDDGKFFPNYREDPGDDQYLEEVVGLCETKIAYPEGLSETNNKEMCPEPYEYDDCVPIPTVMPTSVPSEKETTVASKMDEAGTGENDNNKESTSTDNNSNTMNKGKDDAMNINDKEKGNVEKDAGGEVPYDSVKTNDGSSDGGAVDTGESIGNTGNQSGEEGFDPDGSMATLTFNLLVPLAMLAVWFALV